MSDDLAGFLLVMFAEDEQGARDAGEGHWGTDPSLAMWAAEVTGEDITIYDEGGHTAEQAQHIARWDPARVLAECEVKRRIVELHEHGAATDGSAPRGGFGCEQCSSDSAHGLRGDGWCETLRLLAQPYRERPDFREEWSVDAERAPQAR